MTDLACKTCEGTGYIDPLIFGANWNACPDCVGSGIAAWAVKAATNTIEMMALTTEHSRQYLEQTATLALAAVREEAKNQ